MVKDIHPLSEILQGLNIAQQAGVRVVQSHPIAIVQHIVPKIGQAFQNSALWLKVTQEPTDL